MIVSLIIPSNSPLNVPLIIPSKSPFDTVPLILIDNLPDMFSCPINPKLLSFSPETKPLISPSN